MTLYQAVYVIFYHFGSVLLHNVQIKLGKHVKKKFQKPFTRKKKSFVNVSIYACMMVLKETYLSVCKENTEILFLTEETSKFLATITVNLFSNNCRYG